MKSINKNNAYDAYDGYDAFSKGMTDLKYKAQSATSQLNHDVSGQNLGTVRRRRAANRSHIGALIGQLNQTSRI
ncbi:hypothetical protein N9X05_07070 [Paracoccaceae bacterium]|nr:hypothetical protein [Paracoccaceae bacterium]